MDLVEITRMTAITKDTDLYNNAAQSWNHQFYWMCMKTNGGGRPPTDSKINKLFMQSKYKSYDGFRTAFSDVDTSIFASGWVWLIFGENGLEVS